MPGFTERVSSLPAVVRVVAVACLLALGSAGVSGCGGDDGSAASREAAAAKKRQAQQQAEERATDARQRADEAREVHAACEGQLGTLVNRLGELDSRLSVGLNYDEYTDEVADLRVAYDKIDFDELGEAGVSCLGSIGVPAENALNQFAKAVNQWGTCLDDFGCDTDSIEPKLQRRWSRATDYIDQAKDELDQLADEAEDLEQTATELAATASGGSGPASTASTTGTSQPQDTTAEFARAINNAAGDAVDTVTVEDAGRVAVYLNFGESAQELESKICAAVASVQQDARAAIHEYHDRDQDTSFIVGNCGKLKTP